MKKIYKYRPLSEFLFKIFYQELYFPSYKELNDALDLSARIEFSFKEEKHLEHLLYFLFKTTLKIHEKEFSENESENNRKLLVAAKCYQQGKKKLYYGHA